MLKLVHNAATGAEDEPSTIDLDELCRLAARQMLASALLAERRAYLDAHADVVDGSGHRLVVANGYARERAFMTGAGMVEVKAPGSTTAGKVSTTARSSCLPTCASPPR